MFRSALFKHRYQADQKAPAPGNNNNNNDDNNNNNNNNNNKSSKPNRTLELEMDFSE